MTAERKHDLVECIKICRELLAKKLEPQEEALLLVMLSKYETELGCRTTEVLH